MKSVAMAEVDINKFVKSNKQYFFVRLKEEAIAAIKKTGQ